MKTLQIERKLLPLMLAALLLTACSRESEEALSLPADAHSNAQIIAQTAAADVRLQEQARSGNRSAQIFDTETKLLQREHEKTGASTSRLSARPISVICMFTRLILLMAMRSALWQHPMMLIGSRKVNRFRIQPVF